ncbi:hypothetical protein F5Y14DRAFT_83733 [Nemania sp. NC0429]|nr:hypothetical protein F5Y14DRAFT_83733 [Nemania sp. NC0429]
MPTGRDVGSIRKRKAHKKSRHGCANCKLRSIKCDETKPCCKKCESFNVVCSYGRSKLSPECLTAKPSFRVQIDTVSPAVARSPPAPLPISGSRYSRETYQLVAEDISLLEKFQKRTVWTLGTGATHHVYAAKVLPLAFTSPLLMHTILAMARIHDLVLDPSQCSRTTPLVYHWYHAVASMRRHLSKPIPPAERDMVWISSNLIGISSIAYGDVPSPEEAWPLRPPSPADLSWFTLCDGQKLIAELTDPMRLDSAFYLPAKEMRDLCSWVRGLGKMSTEAKECLVTGMPRRFERFFGISSERPVSLSADGVNDDDNPYYAAAKLASELFQLELDQENFLMHIYFVRALDAPFRDLLIRKDEKAMLLLLYWYAKICDRRLWWLWRRSCIEGLAVCRYLERAWMASGDEEGLGLLELPRMRLMNASRTMKSP